MLYQKLTLFVATVFMVSGAALANPVLSGVESGDVTVQNTDPNTLQVNQASTQAIINWQSFNIAPNEATHFIQPAGGVAINRIDPTQGASQIYGQLTATGKIILINQNGIFFGPGSKVDVTGIIASTANMSNANFLAGKYIFDEPSTLNGSIVNQGQIIAAEHGLVALMGSSVANDGTIRARLGNVVLASGKTFTVDFHGDQLINFAVNQAADARGTNPDANAAPGSRLSDGVRNTGFISAAGGVVVMSARAAEGVLDHVINTTGIVEAKSVGTQNGEIILSGEETPNGIVEIAGTLDASGLDAGSTGGKVHVTGKKILVDNSATINVSGDAGGGEILIGGDAHGLGTLAHADTTVILPEAQLFADAITTGHGGKIVVWSDGLTRAFGEFSAHGGALSGDGGFIETSGHYLEVNGIQINASAANGKAGQWLLDPLNLLIGAPDSNVTASTPFEPSASPATLSVATINAALGLADVTIQTTGTVGGENGDITLFNAMISWSSNNSLTISAAGDYSMNIGSSITSTGSGNLTITTLGNYTQASGTGISLSTGSTYTLNLSTGGTTAVFTNGLSGIDNFVFNGPGTLNANGGISTSGNQTYNGLVTMNTEGSDITLVTTGVGSNITFNNGFSQSDSAGGNAIIQATGGNNRITFNGNLTTAGNMQILNSDATNAGNQINLSGVTSLNGSSGQLNMTLDGTANIITSGTLYSGATSLFTFNGYQNVVGNSTGTLTIPAGPSGKVYPVTLTSATSGSIGDPFYYSGFTYGTYNPTPNLSAIQPTIVSVTTSGTSTYLTGSQTPTNSDIGTQITNDINAINISLEQQDMNDAPTASLVGTCGG